MNFWKGFVIGVIVTQIFLGFVMVKAGIIGDFVAYLESGLTKRPPDAGDSAHIPSSFLRLIIFLVGRLRRPHPSAGNANR